MLRQRCTSLALATGAAALIVVTAAASSHADGVGVPGGGRPDREAGVLMTFDFPATPDPAGVCPFPVRVSDVETNVTVKLYADGSTKGTGHLVTLITNLSEPGKHVERNISGPGRTYTDAAGVFHYVLDGASLNWVLAGKDTTGSVPVGLYIRHGSVEYDGDLNLLSYRGTAENLCDTLG
jgi:hypothetical protein